jgi:hypothetical protein
MGKLFAAVFAVGALMCLSVGAAFAGEITGSGKPTAGPAHANSICVFSGLNDDPGAPLDGSGENGPGGTSQSYGQDNRLGLREPSTENPGKVGRGVFTFHPGFACNGNHGFFAGE